MKCAKCGQPLPGGAVFCPDCGEPVPAGMPTVQLPAPGTSYGGVPPQASSVPSTGAYSAPQGYQPPPPMQPPQPTQQHYGAQQVYPPAGWVQPGAPGQYAAQPPHGYVAPKYSPAPRKSDPLLVCIGVVMILFSLIPLIWLLLLRAPISQWAWLMDFLGNLYFSQLNRLIVGACVLVLLGVPGVILVLKGLRR